MESDVFIHTEPTPNPNTIKFLPGKSVLASGVAEFVSKKEAQAGSALAARLFEIDGVASVFFGADFVAVTKDSGDDWGDIKTYVLGVLFEHFSMEIPVLNAVVDDGRTRENLSATEIKICDILETRIRPAVARDGGDVVFEKFEKGILWLKMRGACSGCPSASMTLKMGIENMMRHMVPEVLEVRAARDD